MAKRSFKSNRKVAVLPLKAEAVLMSAMELRDRIFELGDDHLVAPIDLVVVKAAEVSRASRQSIGSQTAARVAA